MAVSDPGGNYGYRVPRLAVVAAAGALLTALGFGIGGGAWGFVVLAAFVATLLGGLAVTYGLHRFVAAYLLNIWFVIALGLPTLISFDLPGLFGSGLIHTEPWKQALAWLVGSALWIAYTFIMWLARGRVTEPQPVAEIPGDISPRPLTRPIILFAVIRAAALVDRRRDLLRAAPAQRLLDAHGHDHCHEAQPAAIRPRRRAAASPGR